jgi:rRNA maturation endonuclease Nob1
MIDQIETSRRVCKSCGRSLDEQRKDPCPYCGSKDTKIEVVMPESLHISESVEITLIRRIRKTPIYLTV